MIDLNSAVTDRERGFHDEGYGSEVDPRFQLEKYYSIPMSHRKHSDN
jgi:hypothetical protein